MKFTGVPLNRAGNFRDNSDWLDAAQQSTDARFISVWNDQVLFDDNDDELMLRTLGSDHPMTCSYMAGEQVFLGLQDDRPFFALDLSNLVESELKTVSGAATERYVDLRSVMPKLSHEDAALASYAKEMVYWHQHNRFCGLCGAETRFAHAGHMRRCSNEDCGHETFPRTDPVVIMLVERQDQNGNHFCLLGNSGNFSKNRYSTLAGFVDPGESLEEAVAREVFEEAGIRVDNIRYQASQPWPFPASLMIGFRATAVTDEIVIDEKEIVDARWFSIEEVQAAGDWSNETDSGLLIPRKDAIARHLINRWVKDFS